MIGSPRLLLLRRDNIGDLVCTTPLIDALRAQLPHAWLGALVTTYNAAVLARNPALDEVFAYEKLKHRSGGLLSHFRTHLAQIAQLRSRKLDCVLVPATTARSLKLARSLRPAQVIAAPAAIAADVTCRVIWCRAPRNTGESRAGRPARGLLPSVRRCRRPGEWRRETTAASAPVPVACCRER